MAFFPARILAKDGVVIAEDVPVWITFFRMRNQDAWDGHFEIPVRPFPPDPYRIHLGDGRKGKIAHITSLIHGENLIVYFEGNGPLAR